MKAHARILVLLLALAMLLSACGSQEPSGRRAGGQGHADRSGNSAEPTVLTLPTSRTPCRPH